MSAAHPEAVLWFKRSQRGLFAGRTRLSGNHVSPSKAQCVFLAPSRVSAAPLRPLAPSSLLIPPTPPIILLTKSNLTPPNPSPARRSVKRAWLPNVQSKKLWSDALGSSLRLKVTPAALRNIDRVGGLDNYILRSTPKELGSLRAESLRFQMKAALDRKAARAAAAPAEPKLQ